MLAEVTMPSNVRSLGQPSPRSAFKSITGDFPRPCVSKAVIESGLEFGDRDWHELDSIAGPDRKMTFIRYGDTERRPAQQVPSAWRLDGIDSSLAARDRNRAGRHAEPWHISAR